MKKITLLLLLIMSIGCEEMPENKNEFSKKAVSVHFEVVTIDYCEYVVYSMSYQGGITHKGNCYFCLERKSK